MDKKGLSNLGDEIKDIVQNAVNTRDFHQLNRDIGNTINGALDEVRKSLGSNQRPTCDRNQGYGRQRNRQPNHKKWRDNPPVKNNQVQKQYVPVSNVSVPCTPVGRISGILLTIFGNIGIGLLGFAVFVLIIIGNISGRNELFASIVLGLLPFLGGSMFMVVKGKRIRGRVKRFQKYLGVLHGRSYCLIKEFSAHFGQSYKYVVKDLRKMIAIGMFPEGHIDEQQTCLMLNRESYEQYLKTLESMRTRNLQEQQKPENQKSTEQSQKTDKSIGTEIRKALEEGRAYIYQIKETNEMIRGEEISGKLDRLEVVTSKIFNYVENHPGQLSEIQKFMQYYLPTTLKLLNAYKEFDNQSVQGDNISTAKREIENTLDTINTAFENLFDSLYEDVAMDISTDISVLETMLAQEGLTVKDFN